RVYGMSYLSSVGAGSALGLPIDIRWTAVPNFEWRRASIDTLTLFTGFNSGDWYAAGMTSNLKIYEWLKLESRGLYRRGTADFIWNQFNQAAVEAALTIEFAPPADWMSRNWSFIPYVKYMRTEF